MAEVLCPVATCQTATQGGPDGLVAHLRVVHFPGLSDDAVRYHWEAWLRGTFGATQGGHHAAT
jgi:hypothetical protein